MAHPTVQVSTNLKDQHTPPGIAGKGVTVAKRVGWVLMKHHLAERVRQGLQGSRSARVETQSSKRAQNCRG